MIVVLSPGVETRLSTEKQAGPPGGPVRCKNLRAVLRSEENHICVYASDLVPVEYLPPSARRVDCYVSISHPVLESGISDSVKAPGKGPHLLLCVDPADPDSTSAFYFSSSSSSGLPCTLEPIRLESDLFSRVKDVFDSATLSGKAACIIGLGSGGSFGAVELAKCGVGKLILVDFDRLHTHNISRHVCGIKDVGRFKTHAVRDAILQHSPNAEVECWEIDITEDNEVLEGLVVGSDLVFVATDNELSKYLVNDACVSKRVPAVYGGVYERAFAGEVIRVIPGLTGCYACVRSSLSDTAGILTTPSGPDYTDDPALEAEPGLGLDVGFVASLHAKLALLTLLQGSGSTVQDIDSEMIIWVNSAKPEDGDLFATPLSRYFVRAPRVKDCPSCGAE